MIKRNCALLGMSLLISIVYFAIYTLTCEILGYGIQRKLISLAVSILTFFVYYKLGSFISRFDIEESSIVKDILSISSLVVVNILLWIYSFTQSYFIVGIAGLEWFLYLFVNAPFLAVNDLMNWYLPFLYFIYPWITTCIVYMGVKSGESKLMKDVNHTKEQNV